MSKYKITYTIEAEDVGAAMSLAREMASAHAISPSQVKVTAVNQDVRTFGDAVNGVWLQEHRDD